MLSTPIKETQGTDYLEQVCMVTVKKSDHYEWDRSGSLRLLLQIARATEATPVGSNAAPVHLQGPRCPCSALPYAPISLLPGALLTSGTTAPLACKVLSLHRTIKPILYHSERFPFSA